MCAGALSCAVFAQEGQFTDLYYNQDLNTTGWSSDRYMQNPAAWNVGSQDGPLFDGEVNSASNNLYLVSQDPLTSDHSVFSYDRLGIEDRFIDILGKQVPCVTLPIRPGRNLASIVEVAAMNNRHRRYGYNAAEELARKVDLHADLGSKSANQGK